MDWTRRVARRAAERERTRRRRRWTGGEVKRKRSVEIAAALSIGVLGGIVEHRVRAPKWYAACE